VSNGSEALASNSSANEALVESIYTSSEEAQPIIQSEVRSEPTAAASPAGEPEKIEEQPQKLVEDTKAEADLETNKLVEDTKADADDLEAKKPAAKQPATKAKVSLD
jgi:hypothetical protein